MSFKTSTKPVAPATQSEEKKMETKKKADENQLTEHFTLEELATTNNKKYQAMNLAYAKTMRTRLENLAYFLEEVRNECGCPILVTSGVRCPELNKAVGGVATSQHVTGHAADIIPQGNGSVQDHFCRIFNSHLIYDQLILEESNGKIWIHISYKGMAGRREALIYNGKKYVRYKR